MKRRALSFIIVLALCLNLFPAEAFASDVRTGGGLCPHHPAHTDACGYAPPVLGRECTHNHDDGCYTTEINCAHEHTAECYPDSGDASGTEGPSLCAHTCTQDSGCVIQTLSCPHEHDDTCGYVTGNPGARCTFACSICPIDALIGELPSSVSARNAEQVQAQLSEIYALYEELTVDEQQQVDLSPCAALLEQMDGMGSEILSDSSDPAFVLTENTSYNSSLVARIPITLETNGHTLTVQNGNAIQVTGDGKLDIAGGGSVISENGSGVEVQSGGSLRIAALGTSIQGYIYGLDIASGAAVQLSAGTYFGYYGAIRTADGDFRTLLAPGCAYFDENGQQVLPENVVNIKRKGLTVSQCASHSKTYAPNTDSPTHTWTCPYCGTSGTEKCTFIFVQDGDGASTCTDCGNGLTIAVNESDLSNLVYDGTLKPEQVGVTVTLTSPNGVSTTLTKGTDFSVDIEKITDAGQAKVTVTGLTFNGTFVKTYTVAQDKPGIKWDGSTYTVNYDGSAVTAGELPNIIITIKSDADLHPYLRYAYKGTGDADFTDGLPTNAGTYAVKAYLEESQNYEAAETDPLLTLTINQIDPIVNAPVATTPTYNRTAQTLVTAGTLDPVAIADGLTIEFATGENGTYSTDIPTETNAGDYTVWYQVTGLTGNYIAPNPNPAQVLNVKIQRKAITPVVTLSQYSYLYDGGEKQPTVTVTDNEDGHYVINPLDNEYKVEYVNNQNVSTDANPAKVIVADSDANGGNYDITKVEVKFTITSKTQDTLSITQKPNTVTYGDQFTLSTTGGSDSGLVTWEITNGKDTVATVDPNSGQVTVVGHGTATVKATKSGGNNYEDATDTWTFTAVKKPVTARVTAEDKTYDGNAAATVKAVVESGDLAFSDDSITIDGLTGAYDNANVGTGKTVTLDKTSVSITGTNADKYDVSIPATATGAILAIPATCTAPNAVASLTYDAAQSQELVTAGTATGGTMVYSLDGNEFSPNIPKAKDAGKYTVYYKARGDQNHTDSEVKTKDVTIGRQTVTPQIELSPPSGQYDGTVQQPSVTVRDGANNIIPESEYKVTYVTDGGKNWKDQGTYTVKVENITGGNYIITETTAPFTISTTSQARWRLSTNPVSSTMAIPSPLALPAAPAARRSHGAAATRALPTSTPTALSPSRAQAPPPSPLPRRAAATMTRPRPPTLSMP